MTRRAVIYVRISKDREGAGLGIARQAEDCAELADRLGWAIVTTHQDNDLSAYSGKPRPGYRALLADLREPASQPALGSAAGAGSAAPRGCPAAPPVTWRRWSGRPRPAGRSRRPPRAGTTCS